MNQVLPPNIETQLLLGKVFRGITQKLNSDLPYTKILDFVFESMGMIIPFDRMGIALVQPEDDRVSLKWVKSNMPIQNLTGNYSAKIKGSSLENIFKSGQPRIINDLEKYSEEHPQSVSTQLALQDGIRSNMTCPLCSNGKRIGIVFFSSREKNTYENQDIQTFMHIADELSVIVAHGRQQNEFEVSQGREQSLRMVVHDLRSPLNVINGFLELATLEDWFVGLREEDKKIFKIIERNTRYMSELLGELGDLKQSDFENTALTYNDVNVADFCREIATAERHIAARKNIELNIKINNRLYDTARFDSVKIHRVLDNLLTNAFKFSNPGRTVLLKVVCNHDRIEFEVTDQGQGIPESEIPKLFKEFGKTSVRPTGDEPSTGLGLAIARKIVEKHGGAISVNSTAGWGSTFSFWLPRNLHS